MSAYKLDEVLQLWAAGKLTVEQAIGQILQLIQKRDERLRELEGRVAAPGAKGGGKLDVRPQTRPDRSRTLPTRSVGGVRPDLSGLTLMKF